MENIINNKYISDFCNKHPNFDLEGTIISIIKVIEESYSNVVPSLDSNLANKILNKMNEMNQNIKTLESNNMKNEYINNIKDILVINNNEKIIPIIKEYNENFMNKLTLLFKDIIPKEQQNQNYYIESFMKGIEQNILIELNKGFTKDSIDSILNNIEQKFTNIISINEQKNNNDKQLYGKLDKMLDNLGKNCSKGKISENILNFNLQSAFPTADIKNVSGTPHSGDFLMLRKDKCDILIENKNFNDTVQKDDVQKFIDDMNTQNMCGIMISQKSKIVFRENYEIEIHNGNVAVYIHDCNYDTDKIKIAVQIIDTFKSKIEKQKIENGTTFTIDIEILQKINKEFQLFNIKKTQHLSEIKNMCDTLTKSAEDMEFEALDQLLESQGLLTNIKKFVCGKCPRTFKTQKGLDTHERQCTGIETKEKGCKCQYCDEIAKTPKGLKSHIVKKHPDKVQEQESISI
jgi:hypothetical protein